MSDIPENLHYTDSHEWVRQETDDVYTIGITVHAQQLLGDLVFVELPDVEKAVNAGEETGVVESVKAASDVYSPLTGTIFAVNDALVETPELVNQDPYGAGWLYKIKLTETSNLTSLLNAQQYTQKVAEQD